MGTDKISVYHCQQPADLQDFDGPPVRHFTTPWLRGDLGLFYVNVTVVGPVSKQPQGYLPLRRAEADRVLEAVADAVKALQEKLS